MAFLLEDMYLLLVFNDVLYVCLVFNNLSLLLFTCKPFQVGIAPYDQRSSEINGI